MDFAKYTQHAGQFCCVKLRRNYALIEQKYPRNKRDKVHFLAGLARLPVDMEQFGVWRRWFCCYQSSSPLDSWSPALQQVLFFINPCHLWILDLLLYNKCFLWQSNLIRFIVSDPEFFSTAIKGTLYFWIYSYNDEYF